MSYAKMMKWNRKHPKGVRRQYMGFNPSGITSGEIQSREQKFILEMKEKSLEERQQYWSNAKEMQESHEGSWLWKWCVFERNFLSFNKEVL